MAQDQHDHLLEVLAQHVTGLLSTLATNRTHLDAILTAHVNTLTSHQLAINNQTRDTISASGVSLHDHQHELHSGILHRIDNLSTRSDELRRSVIKRLGDNHRSADHQNTTALTNVLLHIQSAMTRALEQALTADKTAQRTETALRDVTAQLIMIRACISHFDMTITTFDDRLGVMEANQFARDESLQADDDDAATTHETTPQRVAPTPQNGPGQVTSSG